MKDRSKAITWLCLTVVVAAGMKYLPSYMLEERKLELEDRILDLREDAILHQQATPTVSVPEEAHANKAQLL